ncbi:hypothetical protein B0H17DRAFT_1079954 [Mycena rosella]|uniref:F-box domain-containing protein n=1 Tax=Mycena rosella TaxID=1033263 RepID=A0AAD7D3W2_MYCRO|nr:hypothetical protein B0H17DRAFT_1079954 [Mycena rosella]
MNKSDSELFSQRPSVDSSPEMNPLHIQELTDRCIDLLSDSEPSLRACSLVSRSWVHPSQSHLFAEINLEHAVAVSEGSLIRTFRLLDVLDASPRLVSYILTLSIWPEVITPALFRRFCNLPYTRLTSLTIYEMYIDLPFDTCVGIQQLLSLPTLLSVDLECPFADKEQFLLIWKHCTGNIKHLTLHCGRIDEGRAAPTVDPGFAAGPQIKLESFQTNNLRDIQWWLDDPRCPLNFAGLKALYFSDGTDVLQRGILAPALKSVEVVMSASQVGDLSGFECLTDLSLMVIHPNTELAFRTIATIVPQSLSRLRAIRFRLIIYTNSDIEKLQSARTLFVLCSELDRRLSELRDTLPNLAIVHISTNSVPTPALTECFFPLLDPGISVQWTFTSFRGWREPVPWYRSIV